MFDSTSTLITRLRSTVSSQSIRCDASVSLLGGIQPEHPHKNEARPRQMRLLLDQGEFAASELYLPSWMTEEEVRAEVVLHAQGLHGEQNVYADHLAIKPQQPPEPTSTSVGLDSQDQTMQLWLVCSTTQDAAQRVWRWCQDLHAQSGDNHSRDNPSDGIDAGTRKGLAKTPLAGAKPSDSTPWRLCAVTPSDPQFAAVNMLPYREARRKQYKNKSLVLLGINLVALASLGLYGYQQSQQHQPVAGVPQRLDIALASPDKAALPSLPVLREQLEQATQQRQQRQTQAHWQAWQVQLLMGLSRGMTEHLSVQRLVAAASVVSLHGQATTLQALTGFVQTLRTRWRGRATVQLISTQQLVNGNVTYHIALHDQAQHAPQGDTAVVGRP